MNPSFDPSQIPLRDIHLPDAVPFWPLAFGWWILVGAVVVALVWAGIRWYAGRRHRAAAGALNRALDDLRAGRDPIDCAQRLSTTLRRFAMTVSDDPDSVAGLTGEPWLAFLDSRWEQNEFADGPGRLLLSAPYRHVGGLKPEQCLELGTVCIAWVRAQPVRV